MSFLNISSNGIPLNNVRGDLVNVDNSHTTQIGFSNNVVPNGPHAMPAPPNNINAAASYYPCSQKGGKINRRKINKISRKYKMKGSKKTVRRHIRQQKSRVRSRYSRRTKTASKSRARGTAIGRGSAKYGGTSSRRFMSGGNGVAVAPNYPAGYSQYNNNRVLSDTYSTGGVLNKNLSALANPPPVTPGKAEPDNLNHSKPNAYGNYGAGSGFPSRGWF
jgi:hypothetical protein